MNIYFEPINDDNFSDLLDMVDKDKSLKLCYSSIENVKDSQLEGFVLVGVDKSIRRIVNQADSLEIWFVFPGQNSCLNLAQIFYYDNSFYDALVSAGLSCASNKVKIPSIRGFLFKDNKNNHYRCGISIEPWHALLTVLVPLFFGLVFLISGVLIPYFRQGVFDYYQQGVCLVLSLIFLFGVTLPSALVVLRDINCLRRLFTGLKRK